MVKRKRTMIYNTRCRKLKIEQHGLSRGRVKSKTVKLVFAASPLSMQHYRVHANTGWLGIGIMCPSGATCLPADLFQLASTIKI